MTDYRSGSVAAPALTVDAAVFETAEGRVELRARQLSVALAGVSLSTVAEGIGAFGQALLLNFAFTGA